MKSLKELLETEFTANEDGIFVGTFTLDRINEIADCITNLQEENDILKRDIEAMKHNYNLLVRCIENGESMTQKFENGLTYQDYKSRNEKAREMIKFIAYNSERPLTITELNKVYNILGGDE